MDFVNATQAADILGVSTQTMSNWLKQGRVSGVLRVGRVWLIPRDSLETIKHPSMGRPRKKAAESGNVSTP